MSYILDALKKSEKERQKGAVPNIMSQQEPPKPEPKKRMLWPYLLVVALLVNTCLLAWWFASHQKGPATAQGPIAGASVVPSPEPLKNAVHGAPASAEKPLSEPSLNVPPRSDNIPSDERLLHARVSGQEGIERRTLKSASAKGPTGAAQEAPLVIQPAPESQVVPAPIKDKIYSLNELPPPLHQGLPGLTISTHLYAEDAGSRIVRINGQMLREGQFLTADLKLEEILPDGVILNFRNYRFRLGLK